MFKVSQSSSRARTVLAIAAAAALLASGAVQATTTSTLENAAAEADLPPQRIVTRDWRKRSRKISFRAASTDRA